MSCKHTNADHLMPGDKFVGQDGFPHVVVGAEQFRCLDCGAWLSLGRSKEADPNVRVELRAAAIAYEVKVRPHGWSKRLNPQEVIGWDRHAACEDPVFNSENQGLPFRGWTAKRWSGWLAREITQHPTQTWIASILPRSA